MRKICLILLIECLLLKTHAQPIQTAKETFEGSLSGWTITPSNSWKSDTNFYTDSHTAYRGIVPIGNNPGDTAVLITPVYDFSGLPFVWLSFNHICKVSTSDICQIEYLLDNVGATWQPLPSSSYKGNGVYFQSKFSHTSYSDWQSTDSLANPINSSWKTEKFNISDEVSYEKVQFRFIIKRGTSSGTYFMYGWLIDNFEIHASTTPFEPPVCKLLNNYNDTIYNTGPFEIKLKATSNNNFPLLNPMLYYSTTFNNNIILDSIVMNAIEGDTIWTAMIPQHVYGSNLNYSIIVHDSMGNRNTVYDGFYIKRASLGSTYGYNYYYPNDTIGGSAQNLALTFNVTKINSWSRSLYLASEIGSSTQEIALTSIAWYNRSYDYAYIRSNVNIYMKCTTATSNTNLIHENPNLNGATLVYSGSITTSLSWNEIILDTLFKISSGSNLMIYFEDSSGVISGTNAIFWAGHLDNTRTIYQFDGMSITQAIMAPLMRFGLGVISEDSNSVALCAINNPIKGSLHGLQPINITIKNEGIQYLDSCTIFWTLNGLLQPPFIYRGFLPEDFTDTVTIGYYTQGLSTFDTIFVWVSMPNGTIDPSTMDDTLSIISYGCNNPLNGEYVIGPSSGADFPSINDALFVASMCGANGDVCLKLQDGSYAENWDFSNLSDLIGGYTLTITSLNGNKDSVILKPISGVGITINNTHNLILKNITIDNTINSSYGIQFTGAANNIIIKNNHLIADKTKTSLTSSPAPIYKSGNTNIAESIKIIGNIIEGGYYGIYFYGGTGTSAYGNNIVIDSNIIMDQYNSASVFYYTNFNSFSHNTILSKTTNSFSTWYGLRFEYCNFEANGNKIHQRDTLITSPYLVSSNYSGYYNANSSSSIFANNELIGHTKNNCYGMYIAASNLINIYNNSIYIDGSASSSCLHIVNSTYSGIDIKNNILVNYSLTGYPIYFTGTTTPFSSDYNCLYGSNNIAYLSKAHISLTDWQTATRKDMNSININPSFVNPTYNLKLINYNGFECYKATNVNIDIEGTVRTVLTSMGSYTAPLSGANAALVEVLHTEKIANTGDIKTLKVIMLNAGLDTITSAVINWSINNVLQPILYWHGNLLSQQFDTLTLGNIIYQNGNNRICVWLSGIGSLTDSISSDDTLFVSTYACSDSIIGDIIIGNNSGADVANFNEALNVAKHCGVKGNLNFLLQKGIYVDNWDFSNLSDIMGAHTLRITSQNGNRDSVILNPKIGAGILLNNTSNLIIEKITVNTLASLTNGLKFLGSAENVEIRNNLFISDTVGTSEATAATPIIKTAGTGTINHVHFIGNTVIGGYYGIQIYGGTSSSHINRGKNCIVDSNVFANQAYYATDFNYTILKSFSYNKSSNRSMYAFPNWTAHRFNQCNGTLINGNTIIGNNTTGDQYGFYLQYFDSTIISNNSIHLFHNGTMSYGFYVMYTKDVHIINNTVFVEGSNATLHYGISITTNSTTYNASVRNNIFIAVGAKTCYPIYLSSTLAINSYDIDYNCYYGPLYVGFASGAKSTLNDFQAVVSSDLHSINLYPSFIDASIDAKLTDYSTLTCPEFPSVTTDIENKMRGAITAMGCYAPKIQDDNGGIIAILNWKTMAYSGETSPAKIVFYNAGLNTITSATIEWSFNNIRQNSINWTGNLLLGESDTLLLDTLVYLGGHNNIKIWISGLGILNDTTHTNDTIEATNYTCVSMLNGYYVIGSTGDFTDMDEAVYNLSQCGINGPVVFAFQPGTYYQNTILGYINGTNDTNTITFTSTTSNMNDVVLQRADDATNQLAPIMIKDAENIIIEHLTLSGISPNSSFYTYANGVMITGTSKNIEIRECYILTPKNSVNALTGTNHSPVYVKNASVSNVNIIHNLIEGGACGIYVYGTSFNERIKNIIIKSNTIGFVDTYGMYVSYGDSVLMEDNRITQRSGNFTPGNMYGIYNVYTNSDILSNKIQATSFYSGIYTTYMNNQSSTPGLIANNEIIGGISSTSHSGMYFYNYTNAKVYNNSVFITGKVAGSGLYVFANNYSKVDIKNNILILNTDEDGYPIYLANTTHIGSQWFVDYNNYYNVKGSNIGYAAGAKTSLTDWKLAVSTDLHSVNIFPNFWNINASLMILDSNGLSCPGLMEVSDDIRDSLRTSATTMGAYHFKPEKLDAMPLTFISSLSNVVTGINTPINIILKNNGLDTITSVFIGYMANGIPSTPYAWSGVLLPGDTSNIQIGSFIPTSYENILRVYTYLPNGMPDQFNYNDTLTVEIFACDSFMQGTYSIGSSGDFKEIEDAIKAIETCGIGGAVVFEIQNGTYTKGVNIGNIRGVNSTNTITFVSQTKNATDVNIYVDHTALRLTNAKHINFEYLTFYGNVMAVEMFEHCENIEFYRCTLASANNTTLTSCRTISYDNSLNSGYYLKDIRFIGNTITGGYYNLYLNYAASSNPEMINCLITVDSNTFEEAYHAGIYSNFYCYFKSISANTITTRNVSTNQYGLYLNSYNTVDEMIGNKFIINSSTTAYGMYLYNYLNLVATSDLALISNNIILISNASTAYGVYANYCNMMLYHNTVSLTATNISYGLYISTVASTNYKLMAKNNIFANLGSGTGYPIYSSTINFVTPTYGTILDYNNYFSLDSNIGYIETLIKSLDTLQSITNQDIHSISTHPNFVSTTNLLLTNYRGFECPRLSKVENDIQGYYRNVVTYMGATVNEPSNKDAALIEFLGFDNIAAGVHPIRVVITNMGYDSLHSAIISGKVNNVSFSPVNVLLNRPLAYRESDTVNLGTLSFIPGLNEMWASINLIGDTLQINDTIHASRFICSYIMHGEYVIGNSTSADYPTLDSLLNDVLLCGINSDITLKLESGVYHQNWNLTNLNDYMDNYSLTIKSLANHKDSVVIANDSNALLVLNNTHNLIVKNITLNATSGTYAVHITGNATNIAFDSCNILANPHSNTYNYGGIYKYTYGGVLKRLSIKHCTINGGYYGVHLNSTAYNYADEIIIDSNIITNQYYYGIYCYYTNLQSVSYNILTSRDTNQGPVWYGVHFHKSKKAGKIIGNRIYTNNDSITGTIYGLSIYNCNSATIANNDIYLHTCASNSHGMDIGYLMDVKFVHNSILLTGPSHTARALYWTLSNDTSDVIMKNNLFVCNTSGAEACAIYLWGSLPLSYMHYYQIDYNNYYSSGNLGYIENTKNTLADWKSKISTDTHSVNMLPTFIDSTKNLKLSDYSNFLAPNIHAMQYDREGVIRGSYTSLGAYDALFSLLDASLQGFDTSNFKYNQNSLINVSMLNLGKNTLTSATIAWKFNGIVQPSFQWTGDIPIFSSTLINIGVVIPVSGMNTIVAWIEDPNNGTDYNHLNDTIRIQIYVCSNALNGVYTVGDPSADFASLEIALNAIKTCGISGNTTLSLTSGSYNSITLQGNIKGASSSSVVSIVSAAGNADSVVIVGNPAISLLQTSNYSFRHVTFNSRTGENAVYISGNTENIEIVHCTILADSVSTTSNTAGIFKGSGTGKVNNVKIIGNVIRGGYYGININGGNSDSEYGTNIIVDSNIIVNQNFCAISFTFVDLLSISYNTLLSKTYNATNFWYGLRFNYCNFNANGNRIHTRTSFQQLYSVYAYYAGYYNTTSPSVFINNEIIGHTSSTYYGIYVYSPCHLNIYNNSIYLDGTGASRCIHVTNSTSTLLDIKNNIIVNASTTGYPIYFEGTSTPFSSDYNCLYSASGNIGYLSSTHTSFASWRFVTGQDSNSINVNPPFININNGLTLHDYSPFIVKRLNDVLVDINGINRSSLTMMGAYSVPIYEGFNLVLTEIVSPKNMNDIHCFDDFSDVNVVIKNGGTENYDFYQDSISLHLSVNGPISFQKDTIIKVGSLTAMMKDTFTITNLLPISLVGTYNIKVYIHSVQDTVYTDDTLQTTYTVHKIGLPYDINFSSVPFEPIIKQVQGTVGWEITSGSGVNPVITPNYGTGRLTFASASGLGSVSQFILNDIDLQGTSNPTLDFWYAHDASSSQTDYMTVKISTDGGTSTQILKTIYRYDISYITPAWAYYVINLSDFTTYSCVSIIFEANSFGGANQNIDRICLSSKSDVALSLLTLKEEDLVACKSSNQSIKVVISNLNTQTIDFDSDTSNIHIEITGAAVANYTYPLSGQLAGLSSDTLEITQTFDMSNNGTYDLIAYIEAIDSNFVNDTSKATIQINNDLSIDNIVGVDAVNCKKIGDSVYVSFTVYNLGNLVVDEIPLRLQINGANDIIDTVYHNLMPGDSLVYAFTKPYIVPTVTYSQPYYLVKVQTLLSCDAQNTNNTREIMACVDLPEMVDLHIQTVNKPLETVCDTGLHTVYVSVTLANKGTSDISSAVLHVEIDSAGTPWASFSETTDAILSNDTSMHIFTQGYIVPNFNGNYSVKVFVDSLTDDENLTNDTLEILACAILNDVSIDAYKTVNWTMEQNIPNPASAITRIPYSIPQEGVIRFTITTITGQVLYSRDIPSAAGSHSLEFDTQHLAGGIYYYSMEYQGQRIVKKMTIQK